MMRFEEISEEQRAKRIHELTYSTESRTEMCERVVALEDLVCIMWMAGDFRSFLLEDELKQRIRELGIEVQ